MCPFAVTVQNVPDRELGPLLTQLSHAGFDSPIITSLGADGASDTVGRLARGRASDLSVAFLTGGSPQQPLVELVAADDCEQTRELVAVIRGSDGRRRMYGPGDTLPALYTKRFRTQTYSERVDHPGAWNKLAVVAREDDDEAILNHALIQSRRRQRA